MSGQQEPSFRAATDSGRTEGDAGLGPDIRSPAPARSTRTAASLAASIRDPLAWGLGLLGLVIAGLSLWWFTGFGGTALSSRLTILPTVPAGAIAAAGAVRLGVATRPDARARTAWSILGLALVVYGAGVLFHFAAGTVPSFDAFWLIGLGLEIAAYLMVAVALALLLKSDRTSYDISLFSLDVAIVTWSAAILIWHFFIFPASESGGRDLGAAFNEAVFPVADVMLVYMIGAIVLRGLRDSSRSALTVAAAALLFAFVGDMITGVETLNGGYAPGGLPGVFDSLAWFGLALAVQLQWLNREDRRPARGLTEYARSFPWFPYAVVAVAVLAPAIHDWNDFDALRQHIPATGLLIALLVARLGVTARQNSALASAERERLATAVDQAGEAILTTDRTGAVTYVNPAFTRITGYKGEDVVGARPSFLREVVDPVRLAEISTAIGQGEAWEGRLNQHRRDGTTVELDAAIAPLRDAAGAIVGSVVVGRDVSRERALELELAQAQRMEAVGRLAGGIAHDFNNILTAIGGFGELASAELARSDPVAADVAADVDEIIRAANRAASLTRSLLAFSRRQVMQVRLIDVNEVLNGLTPMLVRLLGEDVNLVVQLDPDLGLASADSAQLEQVVLNLAVNARDAMPSGGTLTISTANVDLDRAFVRRHVGASEGPHISLTVLDTGIGMSASVMEHAFEPFFTTKELGKGTGLGLSTVIGIVQQSGGSVVVESEPNVGSRFTVLLPRSSETIEPAGVRPGAAVPAGGNETVLVAEDEDAVRGFVERVLSAAGYQVTAARNGDEALLLAKEMATLDLLLTDVVMPGMGGRELAERLGQTYPGLPTIYASGYSDRGAPAGAGGGDAAAYLRKPFSTEELLTRVRKTLDRQPASEAQVLGEPMDA